MAESRLNTDAPAEPTAALIGRVRKLLAMAERTSNPNEADAFARKAAELIIAHRIDPGRLREQSDEALAVREYPIGRGAYVRGRLSLLSVIAEAQSCRVVFEARAEGTVAMVAGFRTDLEAVDVLYTSLHAQASARMASGRRATGAATQRWRRSFLFGYARQLHDMFESTREVAVQQAHPASSALPALRARERQVAEFSRQQFGRTRTAKPPAAAEVRGFEAGRRAAKAADLGHRRFAARRAIGRGA